MKTKIESPNQVKVFYLSECIGGMFIPLLYNSRGVLRGTQGG